MEQEIRHQKEKTLICLTLADHILCTPLTTGTQTTTPLLLSAVVNNKPAGPLHTSPVILPGARGNSRRGKPTAAA